MNHYLLADAHLFPEPESHPGRDRLIAFLEVLIKERPGTLWILGDLFDFWFEYGSVAPAGHWRVLSALRALSDQGWELKVLPGNHDGWLGEHFMAASGASVLSQQVVRTEIAGREAALAHGDGLGSGDLGYRLLLRPLLRSSLAAHLFRLVHPDLGRLFARAFSGTSRRILRRRAETMPEGVAEWASSMLESVDLVVTAHTHLPLVRQLPEGIHLSLGDWIRSFSHARVDQSGVELFVDGERVDDAGWPSRA